MKEYADLEIGLHCLDQYYWNTGQYQLQLRFNRPDDEVDKLDSVDGIQFERDALRKLILNNDEYGKLLGKNLLGDQKAWDFFNNARVAAQSLNVPLRVRLFIGQSASELHNLHWETLRDPEKGDLLLTDGQLLFSRYLSSSNWRTLRLRPKHAEFRALIVIANPTDLADYQLPSLHVEEELKRARASFGEISMTELASGGSANLHNILSHLRERDGYDILYLIAHGKFHENNPWLFLEAEDGSADRIAGNEFVSRIRELSQQPRLIVLASCHSAGTGDDAHTEDEGALAALGPRLADANVPAVIAMQGNISIKTVNQFMPVFFQELVKDGQIDRAMTVARSAVLDRSDWWAPTLFMRLKSGRIWYIPGFAKGTLRQWPGLISSINNEKHRCTAILGPGLSESLIGSRRELARRWAAQYHYPMSPHYQEELPHVAQYLAIDQGSSRFPKESLLKYVKKDLLTRHQDDLPDSAKKLPLEQLLKIIGEKQRKRNPMDPYKVLAELPFHIYINANPGNLLAEALIENGREPKVEIYPWWNHESEQPSVWDDEPDYQPTKDNPLIYHLFGSLQEQDSLVLTEDDYFEYLIGMSKEENPIHHEIAGALNNSALLFLGFHMDAWDFRILFRSIIKFWEGQKRSRDKFTRVAAQITPEEGRVLDTDDARRYLESYFEDIFIYWGSTEDFIQELKERWEKEGDML